MDKSENSEIEVYHSRLDQAKGFGEVYDLVKDTVKRSLGEYRVGMMLYLDNLPLRLGAYHPVGTNIMVLNRILIKMIETSTNSMQIVNAFVYSILLHEYIHALGYLKESDVRYLVNKVTEESFGANHLTTELARKGPWSILRGVPLNVVEAPKHIEVVKDFEKTDTRYIA